MSLVPSSKGGCDCNCHDFNEEENKTFDNSGKPIAKFDVKYIGGHTHQGCSDAIGSMCFNPP
jgi:hypothetical protein